MKPRLITHLDLIKNAASASELETRIRTAWTDFPSRRSWDRIYAAMERRGRELIAAHPRGHLVPSFDRRRRILTVCGRTRRVSGYQNAAGARYTWYYAEQFAKDAMREAGIDDAVARKTWDWCIRYPHRALQIISAMDWVGLETSGGCRSPPLLASSNIGRLASLSNSETTDAAAPRPGISLAGPGMETKRT